MENIKYTIKLRLMAFPYEKLLSYTLRIAKLSKLIFFYKLSLFLRSVSIYAHSLFSAAQNAEQ